MKKYYFKKEMNKDGYSEVFLFDENVDKDLEAIEVLKGAYDNVDDAIHALENSDWYLGLNYRFIEG